MIVPLTVWKSDLCFAPGSQSKPCTPQRLPSGPLFWFDRAPAWHSWQEPKGVTRLSLAVGNNHQNGPIQKKKDKTQHPLSQVLDQTPQNSRLERKKNTQTILQTTNPPPKQKKQQPTPTPSPGRAPISLALSNPTCLGWAKSSFNPLAPPPKKEGWIKFPGVPLNRPQFITLQKDTDIDSLSNQPGLQYIYIYIFKLLFSQWNGEAQAPLARLRFAQPRAAPARRVAAQVTRRRPGAAAAPAARRGSRPGGPCGLATRPTSSRGGWMDGRRG